MVCDKTFNIAFIGSAKLPMIAVRGGAIQTLVTAIVEQNELMPKLNIDVYTCSDELLKPIQYKHTDIVQIKKKKYDIVYDEIWRVIRKIFNYKINTHSGHMDRVNRKLNKKKYDFIIFETTDRLVSEIKYKRDTKVLFHVHADYLDPSNYYVQKVFEKCDGLIAVSDYIKQRLSKGKGNTKVIALKNAIDISAYNISQDETLREDLRKTVGFTKEDVVVIYCSRLSQEKGCLQLIKAVQKVQNCKLLLVGGENFDSDKETPYVKQLKEEIEKIRDRTVVTGYVAHAEVPKYMAMADIGVIPSICNEAASLTMLEMRASSLAVIASNRGGIPEYCDANNVKLIETDELFVENLAQSIQELCDSPELLQNKKKHARNNIEQFDYADYYERFVDMLMDINAGKL